MASSIAVEETMASSIAVKELARKIEEQKNRPSGHAEGESRPLESPEADTAEKSTKDGAGTVRRLTCDIQEKMLRAPSTLNTLAETALQGAVSDLRAAGHEVTSPMMNYALSQAHLGKGIGVEEQVPRVLLREVAVQSALKEAELCGVWGASFAAKESEARLAVMFAFEYEAMFANALRALTSEKPVYVVGVSGYKKVGVDLILSLQSLGDAFEMTVGRETSVAEVTYIVQQDRLATWPAGPGKTIEVKLVGPAGTLLPQDKPISFAVDCEGDVEPDDENVECYPLSVLTGEAWKDMGLAGQTRWKYLREKDFRDLFGMSKEAFEKLPSWKQIPLKKKHGLF